MENVIHRLTLDLIGPDMCPMIEVQRGDSARTLIISLTQGGRPYWIDERLTAALYATKPDGNPLFNACTIEKNRIRYDFTPQTANVAGVFDCEIWLVAGDKREMTTPRFTIAVDERMRTDDVIPESAPEYTAITEMVAAGTAMIEELREALAGLEGVEEILTQARAAAEAASDSEAAAKGHARTAADAAADALGSAGRAYASEQNAVTAWGDAQVQAETAEGYALRAEAAAKKAEEAAAGVGTGGNGSGQNLALDTTLTKSGEAADAKAVGDEIKRVEGKIPSIEGLAKSEDIPTKPEDIGALPNTYTPPNQTAEQVGADPKGTAASAVSEHNASGNAHTDLRLEIQTIREQLTAFLDVDEETLNELSELIARIVSNQTSIAQLTTGKVNVTDIIDNLTTNVANKPLSAAQGVVIKTLIDGLASGKLDASKLTEAINTALAQAKASGAFDGAKGDPGQAATIEITGATALAYGAAPTITEQSGSTAQARKYKMGIPAGKPGADGKTAYQYAKDGGYTGSEDEFAALMAGDLMEPSDGDIPKVFLTGDEFSNMTEDKNEVNMELDYRSKTERFHAYILIKYQGRSSLSKPKKNFTVKMYSDEVRTSKQKMAFKDWGHKTHKYVLKANFIDHSHARNIVGATLWSEVVAARPDYATLPDELRNSPRNGAIDGFPVKLYVNGTYQGIYTWNIGKDDWMWGMDEDNPNHVLLCAETNTGGAFQATPCNFRALWSGVDEEHWSVEVGTNSAAVKTSLNNLIQFLMDNNGSALRSGIGAYLDVQSAIDYYIHQYVICGLDGLALNLLLGTYDGTVWRCGAYDMDSTFGLWWTGESFVSPLYKCPEDYQEKFGLLWERLEENFWAEIQARYAELRQTVYSISNMFTVCERFTSSIGSELYAEDLEVYPTIPQGDTNNIKQLRNYIRDRLAYCDEQILNGVPGTSITLNLNEIALNADPVTLTATVLPSNATDEIMWLSSNEEVATAENGIVTPISTGNCTIRAKCGSGWAVCNVAVSRGATNVMLLDSTTFREGYRYSHSSQAWKEEEEHCYAIFDVPSGAVDVRVRILDNTYHVQLAEDYSSVFLGNTRESFPKTPGAVVDIAITEANGDVRIPVDNSDGYKYCAIPFNRPSWKDSNGVWQYSAELLRTYVVMTINEEIT